MSAKNYNTQDAYPFSDIPYTSLLRTAVYSHAQVDVQ